MRSHPQSTTARLCESSQHTRLLPRRAVPVSHATRKISTQALFVQSFGWHFSLEPTRLAPMKSQELITSKTLLILLPVGDKRKSTFSSSSLVFFGAFHLDICYCCMCVFISASSDKWGAIWCWSTRPALRSSMFFVSVSCVFVSICLKKNIQTIWPLFAVFSWYDRLFSLFCKDVQRSVVHWCTKPRSRRWKARQQQGVALTSGTYAKG